MAQAKLAVKVLLLWLVFWYFHQQLISYGGQQESLGYCRVFHLRKFVQGTET